MDPGPAVMMVRRRVAGVVSPIAAAGLEMKESPKKVGQLQLKLQRKILARRKHSYRASRFNYKTKYRTTIYLFLSPSRGVRGVSGVNITSMFGAAYGRARRWNGSKNHRTSDSDDMSDSGSMLGWARATNTLPPGCSWCNSIANSKKV